MHEKHIKFSVSEHKVCSGFFSPLEVCAVHVVMANKITAGMKPRVAVYKLQ